MNSKQDAVTQSERLLDAVLGAGLKSVPTLSLETGQTLLLTYQNVAGDVAQSVVSLDSVGLVKVFSTAEGAPAVITSVDGQPSGQVDWPDWQAELDRLGVEVRAVDPSAER